MVSPLADRLDATIRHCARRLCPTAQENRSYLAFLLTPGRALGVVLSTLSLAVPSMLFRPFVYIKVSVGSLSAEVVGQSHSVTVPCQALAHPRTLMGEFTAVQEAVKSALEQLGVLAWYKRAPTTLTHLLPKVEGGYTNVELRAFREAALGAGSGQAFLLADHPALSPSDYSEIKKSLGTLIL